MAAASRQWWKVSNPPEVASYLVCHKASSLDLCSFSYITVTFHQWHLPAQLCLPMILSCMTAVLTAQISAIVGFSEDLKRISNWANQWDTTFNASKSMHMFFNLRQPKTGTSPILTLGAVEIPFTERTRHLGVVLTNEPKMDGPCSITDPKAKFSCLCAQTACPA